ncbi:uncharacterized protein LOC124925529 isoform X4 [Impatiens glandulifera]|uniref:uncharacterized protein LOC124925529 isoform X4 n=1 Tax=Impatiens glandulifera TaxID=253017 RepID=UPI001FB13F37|nr:uncharacterized protein LOC124925529 isoform X4 [Impatiens glandulifera]
MTQGGDFVKRDGSFGESIYGEKFPGILYGKFLVMPDQRINDNMRIHGRSVTARKSMDNVHFIFTTFIGIILGFLVGLSFITFSPSQEQKSSSIPAPRTLNLKAYVNESKSNLTIATKLNDTTKMILDTSKLRGAERLPPTLAETKSDLYLRRLWGDPNEDLEMKQRYLVTFTVGSAQKRNVDAAVKKFLGNFSILLFHYDGRVNEWDQFEWSKRAIHVSVPKQTKLRQRIPIF